MQALTDTSSKLFNAGVQSCQNAVFSIRALLAGLFYYNRLNADQIEALASRFEFKAANLSKIENTLSYLNELRVCRVDYIENRTALNRIRTLYFAINSFNEYRGDVKNLSSRVKAVLNNDFQEKLIRREIYLLRLISKVKKIVEESKIGLEDAGGFKETYELLNQDADQIIAKIKGSARLDLRRVYTLREDRFIEARDNYYWRYPIEVFLRRGTELHTGLTLGKDHSFTISHINYIKHQFASLNFIDYVISDSFLLDSAKLLADDNMSYLKELWSGDEIVSRVNSLWDKELDNIHSSPSIHNIKNATMIKYLAVVRYFGFAKQDRGQDIGGKPYQICSEFVVRAIRLSIDRVNNALKEEYFKKTGKLLPNDIIFLKNPFSHMVDPCYTPSDIRKALIAHFKAEPLSSFVENIT